MHFLKAVHWMLIVLSVLVYPLPAAASDYSVAVLKCGDNDKTAKIADAVMSALAENSFTADYVTWENFCRDGGLDKYHCLILTDSTRFPALGRQNLQTFLKRGSDMVLLGGMAFKEDLWQIGDHWGTTRQLRMSLKSPGNVSSRKTLFDFEDAGWDRWRRGATNMENPTQLLSDKGIDGNCMKMDIQDISDYQWDNFRCRVPDKIPAGHNAFVFYARADAQTKYLIFEVIELDGSRWIYPVEVLPDWREYVVALDDFKFFGVDAEGSQKDGILNLADANMISLGLAYGVMPHLSGDHTIWVDKMETGILNLSVDAGKDLKPLELPVFEDRDIYYFQNASRLRTWQQQDILKTAVNLSGSYSGVSAVAFEYPEVSRYIPILSAEDNYSRNMGFACGMLVNYAGEFKNSQWLLFGIDSADFYCGKEFLNTAVELLGRMKKKDLPARLAAEDAADKEKCLPVVSPAPADYITLSKDGKHFLLPDGRKFFALGCNYVGSFERKCEYGEDYFNSRRLEEDFKKAHDAGINAFRFWNFRIENYPDRFKTILELARKYQIYLILQPREHPMPTDKELMAIFQKTLDIAAGQTIVLGYDLMNEPYITTVGSVSIDGQPSEIVRHQTYTKYPPSYFDKKWVAEIMQNPGWPELGDWIRGNDAKNLYAAYSMFQQYAEKFNSPQDYSCLYGFKGTLPQEPDYKAFIEAVDNTFREWIVFHKKVINQSDNHCFVTVGYNSSLAALPANELLDFTSHHIYQKPYSYQDVQKSITTFDRLREFWPNKPITIGEFGFTCGLEMPDGTYLDRYTAGVAEMLVYLYAFANDYSGAYLWMLSEWPVANIKYNAPWVTPDRHIYESRFGMYQYDGTPTGKPKPIAHATKFFRTYIDTHEPGSGNLTVIEVDTPVKTGYIFTDKDALFVGNTQYSSKRLKFQSPRPVNVMLSWDAHGLKAMATADVEIEICPSEFGFSDSSGLKIEGLYDKLTKTAGIIKLQLLEGQTVSFLLEKESHEAKEI